MLSATLAAKEMVAITALEVSFETLSFLPTLRALCQRYLNIIDSWCSSIGVKLSAIKTEAIMFTRKRKWNLDKRLSLRGTSVPLVKEVRYLGVTLDSKLLWKPHMEAASTKALKNLHTLRSACSKSWGLKPSYTLWIYTQIIIPAISHGCVAWSHRLKCSTLANIFNRVQRAALLLVTGALNSTPTCYLDILASLLPLDLHIQKTALKTSLRLRQTGMWTAGLRDSKVPSHAAILLNLASSILPPLPLFDSSASSLNISLSFNLSILDRPEALSFIPSLHATDSLICYTDGSVKNSLAGSGFVIFRGNEVIKEHFSPLGTSVSIFQAELLAILTACNFILSDLSHSPPIPIHFCVDSKSALHALSATIIRSSTVSDTVAALNKLGSLTSTSLHWCPAHSGIQGNETADTLANRGSDSPPIGPSPFAPFTPSYISSLIHGYFKDLHASRLSLFKSPPDFHHLLMSALFASSLSVTSSSRDNTRALTHILTGHNYLRYFQHKIGNEPDDTCKKYDEAPETTEHFLTQCPALIMERHSCFGNFIIRTGTRHFSLPPKAILNFSILTKYLDFFEPP